MVAEAEAAHNGVTLEPDWRTAVADADAVLILAGHDVFASIGPDELAAQVRPGALIYDGRIHYDRARIAGIEAAGLIYMGVGR